MDAEDAHRSRRSLLKTGLAAAGAAALGVSAGTDAEAEASARIPARPSQGAAVSTGAGFVDGCRAAAALDAPRFRT